MKRSGPLRRSKPLQARTRINPRRDRPRRTQANTAGDKRKSRAMPDGRWREVMDRDGWECQAHAFGFALDVPCYGSLIVHHRRLRSQGGGHELSNLVALCGGVTGSEGHHGWAHVQDRAGAEACGLILRGNKS